MQELDRMNHEEIVNLTPEEIRTLCDYECAKNGIKLIDCPAEPEKKTFQPDAKVYKALDFYTESEDVAQKIATFFADIRDQLCDVDYEYKYGNDNKYIQRNISDWKYKVEVSTEDVFMPVTYESLKADLLDYHTKKNEYDSLKKEYKENEEKRNTETKWIHETIRSHVTLESKYREWEKQFEKYLKLADNNHDIAVNFFKKSLTEGERGPVSEYVVKRLTASFEDSKDEDTLLGIAIDDIRQYW